MSASLVGSEMCIRDSSLTHRSQLALPPSQPAWNTHSLKPPARVRWCHCCLLYTSDAADDM
eukprot:57105-Alexandrium_andersonii.AAC.1